MTHNTGKLRIVTPFISYLIIESLCCRSDNRFSRRMRKEKKGLDI